MNQLTLSECSKRRLDETYIVVYAIKNEINIKKGDYIEKSDIYTLIGIDVKGYRQFLNIYQDRVNNNRFWLDCFESLKSRGLKNILFLSVDDNRNMKRTAKIAFPDIIFVDSLTDLVLKFYKYSPEKDFRKLASKLHLLYTRKTLVVHLARNIYGLCPKKEAKEIIGNFKKIYQSSNMDEAKIQLEFFQKEYSKTQKRIVKKVEEFMVYLEPLFELPIEIRKCIYTTNAIESVNSALRKVTRGKGAFPSESSVYKVMYLRIK